MDLTEWNQSYSVNHDEIDNQHKRLFEMANELFQADESNQSEQIISSTLQGLKDYATYHFHSEEKLMEDSDYPDIEYHKTEHKQFCNKVSEFYSARRCKTNQLVIEMIEYLYDWLVNHILNLDKRYAPYLKKPQKEHIGN